MHKATGVGQLIGNSKATMRGHEWGYVPGGLLGIVAVVLLVLMLLGFFR